MKALDKKLLGRAKVVRSVLKMFLRDNERNDLDGLLKRQRRPAKDRPMMDDILLPDDVMRLIGAAEFLRDRAFISLLASTGGRVGEILHLKFKDVQPIKGDGFQVVFRKPKVKGQGRYSPPIAGAYAKHLEAWVKAAPARGNLESWLFPSGRDAEKPVSEGTTLALLQGLKAKAGIAKAVNHHWFRHSRISWAFINREGDLGRICQWFWGKPVTPMANLYSHFSGLETELGAPTYVELPSVPAMPTDAVDLRAEMKAMREEVRQEVLAEIQRAKEEREAEFEAKLAQTMIDAGYGDILKEKGIKEGIKAVFAKVGP